MDYISTIQASKKWNISPTRITILAKTGRIFGAIQVGSRWMIPSDTQKPMDKRTKNVKDKCENISFRFPHFAGKNIDNFNPPLSNEELQFKNASEAFYACDFDEAEILLADLPEKTQDIYIKIATLHLKCVINLMKNKQSVFFDAYGKLNAIFQTDFTYKKEMSVYLHELNATLGIGNYFCQKLVIDPTYQYHNSFYSHLSTLPYISLFYSDNRKIMLADLNIYETNCKLMETLKSPIDSQTIHLYLGFINDTLEQKERAVYHFQKALEIAEQYNLIWLPAMQYYYFEHSIEPALKMFSADFNERIKNLSEDIHNRYVRFTHQSQIENIFNLISKNKYPYIFYAIKGYSNKEVAKLMNISEKTVSKIYCKLYETLCVENKKELVDFYLNSINDNVK